jgi:hypothetical protein
MGKGFSAIDFVKRSLEFEQQKTQQEQQKSVQIEKGEVLPEKKQELPPAKIPSKEKVSSGKKLLKTEELRINYNFYKMPNSVEDHIMPSLSTSEEIVYRRLIRLSWGWGKNYCRAGFKYLQDVSGIKSRSTIKEALDSLIAKKLIYNYTEDGYADRNQQGTLYIVPIPDTPEEEISAIADITDIANIGEEKLFDNSEIGKLSPDEIVSKFYEGIGQTKVPTNKRKKAEKDIDELLNDKFSIEDIEFAVEWTLKNSTEKIYDFSIIKHTIGQASAEKRKVEEQKTRRLNEEKIAAERIAKENKRDEELTKIKAHRESMSPKDTADLRKKAESEIRNCGKYREEFITDLLIETKENELIGKKLGIELPE